MPTRRRAIALFGGTTLLTLSGCAGFITGEDAYEESAEPARVEESTVDETDYSLDTLEENVVEEEFEIAGEQRSVVATSWVGTYEKSIDVPLLGAAKTGVFAVISTPAFEIAGRTLNPVGDLDDDELADMLTSEYEYLNVRGEEETLTYSVLGDTVEVSKLDAAGGIHGEEIDVYVQTGSLRNEDDFLVPFAVYPQEFADEEEPVLERLAEAIEHPTDA